MGETQAVIVALPRAVDPIRLVGDEDKHATLLYFGETTSLPESAKSDLLQTLSVVSNMFSPFSEEIIDVGRLGNDVPPALVAKLSSRRLGVLRDSLKINPAISTYTANTTQYPDYVPHVTLDFPDYQGEDALKQLIKSIYEVQFDRLALWWNDEQIEVPLGHDIRTSKDMIHSDLVGAFLSHHGIRGMKWGIKRSQNALDSSAGRKPGTDNSGKDRDSKRSMDKMKVGSVVTMVDEHGNPKTMFKKKDGTWQETFVSADAERLIKTNLKPGHEMSDREIREAVQRANLVKQYDDIFSGGPNAQLKAQVEAMRLQKDYSQLSKELSPPKKSAVQTLIKTAGSAYGAYSMLDKAVGGELSKNLGAKVGAAFDPAGTAALAREMAVKSRNSSLKDDASARKAVAEAKLAEIKVKNAKNKKSDG